MDASILPCLVLVLLVEQVRGQSFSISTVRLQENHLKHNLELCFFLVKRRWNCPFLAWPKVLNLRAITAIFDTNDSFIFISLLIGKQQVNYSPYPLIA